VPAVVRRLVEHRLPELVVAAVADDSHVSHAAAAPGRFPGRLADARVQLTCALPGHSAWPNGQHSGLFSNRETGTK
jgi:hypothetical protein